MQYSSTKWETGRQNVGNLKEIEYFQSFYPVSMKQLQTYVAAECDRMEYPNSPMYDEYPDRTMIHQVCRNICRNIPEEMSRGLTNASSSYGEEYEWNDTDVEKVEIYELTQMQQMHHGRPPGPPPWGPPPWGPPPRPPAPPRPPHHGPGRPDWKEDIVRVLLLNEMQRRRCGTGHCF